MQAIPGIGAVPAQTFQTVLSGQNCSFSLYTRTGYDFNDLTLNTVNTNLYMDLTVNGVSITTGAICLNEKRLLINRQYFGFIGDLMFVDTQGTEDPQYAGLGTRWQLVYVEAADLAAIVVQ